MTRRIALIFSIFSTCLAHAQWNQWRGPQRDGQLTEDIEFHVKTLKQIWQVDLAEGYSSPVTDGELIFTLETLDQQTEIARAFDFDTGEQRWEIKWEGAIKVPFYAAKNGSWVRATPAVADGAVYFCGMRDVLVKVDTATGKEIWRVDFVERYETQTPTFGYISSPLVDGDAIYVQAGNATCKLSTETGETIWRVHVDERAMFSNAFSSPVLATIHGEQQLIVQKRNALVGLKPESGETVWEVPVKAFRGMNILTPTVYGNKIFTASFGGGAFCFEIESPMDGVSKVTSLWSDAELEGYMSSPTLVEDHLYLLARDKKCYCIEMATGKRKWDTEETFGEYWSMIASTNRVLALDQRGELISFQASPEEFKLVDRRTISEQPTWAHLGYSNGKLLIRGLKQLSVYQFD